MNEILRNKQHEHFAQLVAKGERPGRAYVTAGYSEKGADQSAARLLRNAQICERIAQLRAAIEQPARERAIEKAAVDKAWVLSNLTKIVSMGMSAEPVTDDEGNPVGEYRTNLAAANKALELVGKELGMFIDRKEVRTGPLDGVPRDDIKRMVDVLRSASDGAEAGPRSSSRATH